MDPVKYAEICKKMQICVKICIHNMQIYVKICKLFANMSKIVQKICKYM